jgi:hypothetical protein
MDHIHVPSRDEVARRTPDCLTQQQREAEPAYVWYMEAEDDRVILINAMNRLRLVVFREDAPASRRLIFLNQDFRLQAYGFTEATSRDYIHIRVYIGYTRAPCLVFISKRQVCDEHWRITGEVNEGIPEVYKLRGAYLS